MASMVSAVLDRAGSSARTDPRRSQRVAFVAWGSVPGRSEEIARALGGRARCFFPPRTSRPPAAVRYVLSALATVAWLAKERPNAVIVTNPPVFAGLVAYICSRVLGAPLVLDSHPGGFGVQGDRISARLQPMHRWLARRAEAVLVTDETWRSKVES
ncbi:MAG: glycosyltransferase, partial [Acidimicrobiales bacterium]